MKVGLIDVDGHNFPNLALMKLSAWHKSQGDHVEWCVPIMHYNRVYQSRVFDDTYSTDIDCEYAGGIVWRHGLKNLMKKSMS